LDASAQFSLLNTDSITAWAWDRSLTNASYTSLLLKTFNITVTQLEAIWYWRIESFGPQFIYPNAIEKYNLTKISDIGWAQWSAGYDILGGSVDSPVSIHDLFPTEEIGYYNTVELFCYPPPDPPVLSWQDTQRILDPVSGLGNMTIFQDYAFAMSNQTSSTNFSRWGMLQPQAEQIFSYLLYAGVLQVGPALQAVFGESGGFILNQTVDDWVFNCNYFLLNLLIVDPPDCSLLVNRTIFNNATIISGKNNISAINQYVEWNGSPIVSGLWATNVPVKGRTELGQFQVNQNKETVLQTFNDEFVRTMTLNYNSSSSVHDIDTNHFVLNYSDTFSPNPTYFQSIPGFANLTAVKLAPMYYSLWDMLYVDEFYRKKVIGLNEKTTESECTTAIDVEPITGNTLKSQKRLQANMYTPFGCENNWCNNSASSLNNFAFSPDTFFPLVKAGEYTEVTSSLASKIRIQIDALKYGTPYGLLVGLTVGIFMLILGVALIIFGKRKLSNEYEPIEGFSLSNRK